MKSGNAAGSGCGAAGNDGATGNLARDGKGSALQELPDGPRQSRIERMRLRPGERDDRACIDHEPLCDREGGAGEKRDGAAIARRPGGARKAEHFGHPAARLVARTSARYRPHSSVARRVASVYAATRVAHVDVERVDATVMARDQQPTDI